jgi:hypothetical protein
VLNKKYIIQQLRNMYNYYAPIKMQKGDCNDMRRKDEREKAREKEKEKGRKRTERKEEGRKERKRMKEGREGGGREGGKDKKKCYQVRPAMSCVKPHCGVGSVS